MKPTAVQLVVGLLRQEGGGRGVIPPAVEAQRNVNLEPYTEDVIEIQDSFKHVADVDMEDHPSDHHRSCPRVSISMFYLA